MLFPAYSHDTTTHHTHTTPHRYAKEDGDLESLERDLNEETGWKLVHGDVFRPPSQRMLLAAVVGTGIQLVMLGLFVILLTIMGTFYEVGRQLSVRGGFGEAWRHLGFEDRWRFGPGGGGM